MNFIKIKIPITSKIKYCKSQVEESFNRAKIALSLFRSLYLSPLFILILYSLIQLPFNIIINEYLPLPFTPPSLSPSSPILYMII